MPDSAAVGVIAHCLHGDVCSPNCTECGPKGDGWSHDDGFLAERVVADLAEAGFSIVITREYEGLRILAQAYIDLAGGGTPTEDTNDPGPPNPQHVPESFFEDLSKAKAVEREPFMVTWDDDSLPEITVDFNWVRRTKTGKNRLRAFIDDCPQALHVGDHVIARADDETAVRMIVDELTDDMVYLVGTARAEGTHHE